MGSLPVIFKEYILSHYAKVVDGKVVSVIVAEAEFFETFVDSSAGTWIKNSYNTHGTQLPEGRPFRGNFATTLRIMGTKPAHSVMGSACCYAC